MTGIQTDYDLYYPDVPGSKEKSYIRSIVSKRLEDAACRAWLIAECASMARALYSQLYAPGHEQTVKYQTVAQFVNAQKLIVPISKNWKGNPQAFDEELVKDALLVVGFVPDRIAVAIAKRKVRFRSSYYYEITFNVLPVLSEELRELSQQWTDLVHGSDSVPEQE